MRTIGKYQILGLLGRGGMGVVYKAQHLQLGHIAALKVLSPSDILEAVVGTQELERRFLLEARTMAGLRHENIAPVWDMGHDDTGRPYFVMEYCCNNVGAVIGETYRVEEPSRVLRIDRAVDIVRQALSGLARLHSAAIIHRDVKPFNLLLENSGRVRLIDFGLSKLRGERLALHGSENVGSPYYAAPEQEADPEAADARSDLFSVGVMLARMLTGYLPQLSSEAPSSMNQDLDAQWDAFLSRACAPAPHDRYPGALAMIDALDALMSAWQERTAGTCSLPEQVEMPVEASAFGSEPRSEPLKTGPKVGPQFFGLDALWRPVWFPATDYLAQSGGTILDRVSGLVWESGGSQYPLTREDAVAYVAKLNRDRFAARVNWRLPTVPELMTLLRPVAHGRDFCIEPLFHTDRVLLWSADSRSFTSAWSANAELGFITHHDNTCHLFARAVCLA